MKRVLLFIIIFILFIPILVNAEICDNNKISISSITMDNIVGDVEEINPATASGRVVNLNLNMINVGDNIQYKIVVKNDSNEDYELDRNSLNIESNYLNYKIETDDNTNIVKAKSSKTINLNVEYNKAVPDSAYQNGVFSDEVTMKVNLSSEELNNPIKNPVTGVRYLIFILLVIFILSIVFIKYSNKRKLVLLVGLFLIPISVKALCKVDISINSSVVIEKPIQCISFSEDSWDVISHNVKSGNTQCYNVGDTREIDMGEYGTHILRLSNKSTPEACNQEEFSQTACGFVVEYEDIIFKRGFNSTTSNAGGWRDSEIREIINTDIYNSLPEDLRNVIINTKAISGHERGVEDNYITTDKMYLLSTSELWAKCGTNDIGYDSADQLTRQLDYYEGLGVNSQNYDAANKKYNNSETPWWLRTAHKNSDNYVGNVYYGQTNAYHGHASLVYGISPAFRIG